MEGGKVTCGCKNNDSGHGGKGAKEAVEIHQANRASLEGTAQVPCLLPVAATSQLTNKASSLREFSVSPLRPHQYISLLKSLSGAELLHRSPLVG